LVHTVTEETWMLKVLGVCFNGVAFCVIGLVYVSLLVTTSHLIYVLNHHDH
jgi:hypothetical protein